MGKKRKILIVEDDKPSALLLKQMLEKIGYSVLGPVDTGEKAVEVALQLIPDLILMDITLKGEMDGIAASEKIFSSTGIPSVYATVSTDDETIERAKKTVPYGYILKPYDKNMIFATVEMALYKIDVEKKLRENEERNRNIINSLPDTVFYLKNDGSFADKIEEEFSMNLWPRKMSEKAMPIIKRVLKGHKTEIFEYTLKRSGGDTHCEARIVYADENRLLVMVRDITDKKEAEAELENYRKNLEELVEKRTGELMAASNDLNSEIQLRKKIDLDKKIFSHAIEQSPNVVVIINRNGIVEYVNTAFTEVSGHNKNDVIGSDVKVHGNRVISEPEVWNSMTQMKMWKGEIYNLRKDKSIYYLRAYVTTLKGDDGKIQNYIITAEDITEEKQEKMNIDQVKESLEKSSKDLVNTEMEWKEWKEKMLERNVSRTDKSLFKNIHNSFTQGAGFGALISLLDMLASGAEKNRNGYVVDEKIFDLIQTNVNMVKDAFKTFTSIDWIISNDFKLAKVSLIDLYGNIKAIISKANEFSDINQNKIIISDFNYSFKDYCVNLNKEFFYKAMFEVLINALKFSKRNSLITVLLSVINKNAVISVINDPEKSDEGVTGIPLEYEKVIFEPFYRLTKIVHEQFSTLEFGLGLTLVEKIIGKHGGEVIAKNITDHSSRREPQTKVNLSITLPLL